MNSLQLLIDHPELASQLKFEITGSEIIALINAAKKQPNEVYLTVSEVTAQLKISKTTLWKMDKEGKTSPIMLGGVKRYRLSDINNL